MKLIVIVLSAFLAVVTANKGMAESWQSGYCYCPTGADASCTPQCNDAYTCNSHGTCNNDGTCTCAAHFTGQWCDQCERGWANGPKGECTVVDVDCTDDAPAPYGCSGLGKCTSTGTCECFQPKHSGPYCQRCRQPDWGFGDFPACGYCTAEETCNAKGVCGKGGVCVCRPGFGGRYCNLCTSASKTYPNCDDGQAAADASKAKAAAGQCEGSSPSPVLPVLLSIFGTLAVAAVGLAAFKYFQSKKPPVQTKGNWSEFEKESATSYSQL